MRAVIVEDSAEDRLNLATLLRRSPGIEILGEAATLAEARLLLTRPDIDLLFLDIEIGRESGLDLLASLDPRSRVILTSVHRQYGDWAFDNGITDYLVKPVTEDRLQRTLLRAASPPRSRDTLDRVAVHRSGSARQVIALDTIAAIIGDDKYSRVISGSTEHPDHRSLREWQALLDGYGFERIDRSTLVRPERIHSLRPYGRGAHIIFRHSAPEIEIGRAGRERLQAILVQQGTSPHTPKP